MTHHPAAAPSPPPAAPPARKPRRRRFLRLLLAGGGATVLLIASVAMVNRIELGARAIVTAPNSGRTGFPLTPASELAERGIAYELRIDVGPPDATLAVWIVDPPPQRDGRVVPRGTVLYFHGIYDSKRALLPTALAHAQRGYRGVLVDSRGQGQSTGRWLTFGAHEVRDYRQLLDELARRGLLSGKLAIYGASYGAGVGVQLAARDERIVAAIALAPFCSMRDVIAARAQSLGLTTLFSRNDLAAAVARAEQLAGFSAADSDGLAALHSRRVPLLVFHGRRDATIPAAQGAAICAAGHAGSKLVLIDDATHDDWTRAGHARLWSESTAWLDQWIGGPP